MNPLKVQKAMRKMNRREKKELIASQMRTIDKQIEIHMLS